MKAEELMIGDWVCQRESGLVLKVSKINPPYIEAEGEGGQFHEDTIEPVELTAELMKLNGFTIIEVGDNGHGTPRQYLNRYEKWFCKTTWNDITVWFDRFTKRWCLHGLNQVSFNDVHMLQHAYRFYGYNTEIVLR